MPKLPVVSGAEVVKRLQRAGWHIARQRGSHVVLLKSGSIVSLSVPQHRELAPGTLRSIIRSSGLTIEAFQELA
ncbi:MAG: type II toxin-antitoxin system HicA family toxin [Planctomycetaceae bacterium]|nr:type II toxin-antitoxin system HicA family toxin [Planctomycetaceae bacterium]